MSKIFYNKLIRDRIPEIIRSAGKACEIEVMTEEEYIQALRTKLVEEAQEAQNASPDALVMELADLQEVISALMKILNLTAEQVNKIQSARRDERGGFESRLKLIWSG